MIRGEVTPNREAVISIVVFSEAGSKEQLKAVLDTGFTGYLTMP